MCALIVMHFGISGNLLELNSQKSNYLLMECLGLMFSLFSMTRLGNTKNVVE